MSSDPHTAIAARLRADGQRYTAGRRKLVDALDDADRPFTIQQLLAAEPALPQSSLYRNLAGLEKAGVVHRIVTNDDYARYELAESLTDHHHHHLVCTACGDVSDFTLPAAMETQLQAIERHVAKKTGFTVDRHQLDLLGVCPNCRDRA